MHDLLSISYHKLLYNDLMIDLITIDNCGYHASNCNHTIPSIYNIANICFGNVVGDNNVNVILDKLSYNCFIDTKY